MPLALELIGLTIMIGLAAFFSLSETALTALSRLKIRDLVKRSVEDGVLSEAELNELEEWIKHPDRYLSTILVGNNLVNIASSILAVSITNQVLEALGANRLTVWAGVIAFCWITYIILVFTEIVPKTYAKHHPETIARRAVVILHFLDRFPLKPFVLVFLGSTRRIMRLMGISSELDASAGVPITEDEIRMLIRISHAAGYIEREQRTMLDNIFHITDLTIKEVMVPRIDIQCLAEDASLEDAVRVFENTGHSRLPVYRGSIDNIIGILHVKDLFYLLGNKDLFYLFSDKEHKDIPLAAILRPVHFVPGTKKVSKVLAEFRQEKIHMAIVVDEYGGTEGLVTMEDILEEIVGEIQDEYDQEEALYRKLEGGIWEVDARISMHELEGLLEVTFPKGDYDTLAGYILSLAGHLPVADETLTDEQFRYTILSVKDQRVQTVRLQPLTENISSQGDNDDRKNI